MIHRALATPLGRSLQGLVLVLFAFLLWWPAGIVVGVAVCTVATVSLERWTRRGDPQPAPTPAAHLSPQEVLVHLGFEPGA